MSDLAKQKRGRKQYVDLTEEGQEKVVEIMRERRNEESDPIPFSPPTLEQTWRARELFSFLWRHLEIGIAPGYRDVMLFLIEKTNSKTGRLDWSQSKIARVMKLTRQYVNEALMWWAEATPYLRSQPRFNRYGRQVSSAYHLQWGAIETEWTLINASLALDHDSGVNMHQTPGVNTYPTPGVNNDPTPSDRSANRKCKEEVHPERAELSARDSAPSNLVPESLLKKYGLQE